MPLWIFSHRESKNTSAEIEPITNIAHSDSDDTGDRKERQKAEGNATSCSSTYDRFLLTKNAISKRDARISNPDVESIECLITRFAKEMNTAEELICKKKDNKKMFELQNYETDRRYQIWKEDREKMFNRLQIHWIDQLIDSPLECTTYLLRITTTAGLCYGIGRTTYLYRTMDKLYAKLNGVTLSRIAFNEIAVAVTKSSLVAFAGLNGIFLGKVLSSLGSTVWTSDVSQPERAWWHVTNCVLMCGIMSGASLALINYPVLTLKGMKMIVGTFGAIGGTAGLYLGYFVYRPFATTRTHHIYDAYWRPWYERRVKMDGGGNVRGRYV
ncbi:unnamed protein product [Phytomonas sp. Hart1]|nr:unnamed protein product [Phytomonas sp. Hart1]|eukprot:CCW68888.1 unnamed protein product [Phytomonas sp. isolate Hart1]